MTVVSWNTTRTQKERCVLLTTPSTALREAFARLCPDSFPIIVVIDPCERTLDDGRQVRGNLAPVLHVRRLLLLEDIGARYFEVPNGRVDAEVLEGRKQSRWGRLLPDLW